MRREITGRSRGLPVSLVWGSPAQLFGEVTVMALPHTLEMLPCVAQPQSKTGRDMQLLGR